MTLCTNLYRRGAIYWWRGRFTGPDAASRTIAFSLRVYEPARARLLGVRLNAEAERLRHRLEARMVDHEDVDKSLGETLEAGLSATITWTLSEQAEKSLAAFESEKKGAQQPLGLVLETRPTTAQIDRVHAKIAEADAIDLRRASDHARMQVAFDEHGYILGIENTPCADGVMAAVYKIVAYRGSAAKLTAEDEADLVREGRSRADIETIRILVLEVAADERRESWRLGPTRDVISNALINDGIEPTLNTIHAVRRQVLLSRASLLRIFADQKVSSEESSRLTVHPFLVPPEPHRDTPAPVNLATSSASIQPVEGEVRPAAADEDVTFISLTEDFLDKKKKSMGDHSRRQYRAVARLFIKLAGTDKPHALGQANIGAFFDLLPKLPKSHGKSPDDEKRSIAEIIARGEAAVLRTGRPRSELIGLDPPTVDRYVTHLGALLKYMRGRGFRIGDLDTLADMREKDTEADEDKRLSFSEAEENTLFESAPWAGCESEGNRCARGAIVIHDSLFFLPILAKYALLSLSEAAGIMLDDVDVGATIPSIEIRMNALRTSLKTPTRGRRQPIHAELIRLGFLHYVERLRSLGFTILFPDLRLRSAVTPMSNLFDKIWVPALDAALPSARSQKKTLHSLRKGGNTTLTAIPGIVAPEVRLQLMGHKQVSVNGRHYIAPFPDNVKLQALTQLPITTSGILSTEIHLASAVLGEALKLGRSDDRII